MRKKKVRKELNRGKKKKKKKKLKDKKMIREKC